MPDDADNEGRDSQPSDIVRTDHLPEEVRSILNSVIKQYETSEQQRILEERMDLDEEVLDLIAKAIAAVEDFDQQHQIGHRKSQNRKIVHERLMEFFKHAGHNGVGIEIDWCDIRSFFI